MHGITRANNPYVNVNAGIGTQRVGNTVAPQQTTATQRTANTNTTPFAPNSSAQLQEEPKSVAAAIHQDAEARVAQVNSAQAPDGVDQDLWSVLTKEERGFFVKAGSMGALTYGKFQQTSGAATPIMRGGRLDVRA